MDPFDLLTFVFSQEVVDALETRILANQSSAPETRPESEFRGWLYVNLVRLNALMHFTQRQTQMGKIVADKDDYMLATELLNSLMVRR